MHYVISNFTNVIKPFPEFYSIKLNVDLGPTLLVFHQPYVLAKCQIGHTVYHATDVLLITNSTKFLYREFSIDQFANVILDLSDKEKYYEFLKSGAEKRGTVADNMNLMTLAYLEKYEELLA